MTASQIVQQRSSSYQHQILEELFTQGRLSQTTMQYLRLERMEDNECTCNEK